jgi:hypothetical protein
MATTTTTTNKPLNPRAQDLSPKGYNRAALYSGKALDFDGVNDYIGIPSTFDSTIVNGAFTFVATINKSNNATDNDRLIDISIDANNTLQIITDDASQRFAVLLISGGVTKVNALTYSPIEFGRIVNVAFTFDGSTLAAFYLNSRAVAAVGSTAIGYGSSGVSIGRRNDGVGSGWFGGTMAGVKLFNVALTAAQVSDLYLNPEKIVPDGVASSALKLWLPMMEGAGASAYDGSGNGNDGTINGATWTAGIGAPVAQTALVSWNKGTNNLIKTDDYTNATYWSRPSSTPTSSPIRVPNADEDSVLITETTATGTHGIYNNGALTIAANDTYTMSVFAKAGTRNWLIIDHFTGTTNYNWFDLSTGSVGTTGSGVTASIRDAGDGWYQCSVTRTTTSTVSVYIGVYLSTGDGVSSYLGASGTGYFYGLSITQGSNATYVPNPTTTSITSARITPRRVNGGRIYHGCQCV